MKSTIRFHQWKLAWVSLLSLEQGIYWQKCVTQTKTGEIRGRSVGFELVDKGVAREGYKVLCGGEEVGHVTSGMFSPNHQEICGYGMVTARARHPETQNLRCHSL
jgi:aminomethyltransferase